MRKLLLFLFLAVFALQAETAPQPQPKPAKKTHTLSGWLRKLASAEVEGAMRLSGAGIPDPDRPPRSKRSVMAADSAPTPGRS